MTYFSFLLNIFMKFIGINVEAVKVLLGCYSLDFNIFQLCLCCWKLSGA